MDIKKVDTAIIGGGIAGLACAHQLTTHNRDFILISEDIGGRILTAEDGTVNYGAFFVCNDYHNFLPFVSLGPRIRLQDFCFHGEKENYVLYSPQLIPYIGDFVKIKWILRRFRKRFRALRKKALWQSQKTLIEQDPWLHHLYMMDAIDFIEKHAIEQGTNQYLSYGLYSTTFSPITKMNAFSFLEFLLPLITPIYMFNFKKEHLTAPFKENITLASVKYLEYKNSRYMIKTDSKKYSTHHVVLATEIGWSASYANISTMNKPVTTNMLHITGTPKKDISRKRFHLFTYPSNIQAIAEQENGTYLVYYKNVTPDLNIFFSDSQVITHHFWNPAGRINGHTLIESNQGNNMYLIGDHNIVGLEETFITGLYAANQIIQS